MIERGSGATLVAIVFCAGLAQATPPSGYELTWSDEFIGTSLDLGNWEYRLLGSRRDAINTEDAVSVDGGQLSITTYTDGGTHFTGMIGTQNTLLQTYGYWEARIQFNSSAGMWSAFWLQSPTYGDYIGDPGMSGTEIDIIEHRAFDNNGNNIESTVFNNIHWDGYGSDHKSEGYGESLTCVGNGSWNTYGLLWDDESYSFYVDDVLIRRTTTAGISMRSEYIILSSEVDDWSWAGSIPTGGYGSFATSTTTMNVDFVRVYHIPDLDGDFDGDGDVDGADFLAWQRGELSNPLSAADLAYWEANFGIVASLAAATVPEPTTLILALLGLACRRKRG